MQAATQDRYADPALGNVTGSNAVNVFLGLGLPWVIAAHYNANNYGDRPGYVGYFVPAGTLGFSVVLFTVLAVTGLIFLCIRRKVVGGELGGTTTGRAFGCFFLVSLWLIYIVLSILQATGKLGDPKDLAMGIDLSA